MESMSDETILGAVEDLIESEMIVSQKSKIEVKDKSRKKERNADELT